MRLFTRYLAREIYSSIMLVFVALLCLFAFLDLIHELGDMHGDYRLSFVVMFVLLTLPGHIYELFPVAVLIGTIVALVQLAAHSELTVFRASGASLRQMAMAMLKIGLPLVGLCLLTGEVIAPPSERLAQEMRLRAKNQEVSVREFRSGVWVKDDHSFVNARRMLPDKSLLNLSIYQFDDSYHLRAVTSAQRAVYRDEGKWQLEGVSRTDFAPAGASAVASTSEKMEWRSAVTPDLLGVLLVVPEQMSILSLYQYTSYLSDNRQKTARYEIAMWNKLIYPFAVLVMMMLALPFATHHHRSSGISGKIFLGIVLGLTYRFIGKLFSDLGALNDWQPILSATAMTWLFLGMAATMLWWTERR
jgi:lipopolysaccharide export system permease protein